MKKFSILIIFAVSSVKAQWIEKPEIAKEMKSRVKGLLIGDNIKFYKLNNVYQNMYTMNQGRSKHNDITPIRNENPWTTSGGMHHIDRSLWENVTALDLGGKKIKYQIEEVDVRAFNTVGMHRWYFPEGTLAYDILINKKTGKIFEIRIQKKLNNDKWDDGEVFRPEINSNNNEESKQGYSWEFNSNYYIDNTLTARAFTFTSKKAIDSNSKLVSTPRTKLIIDNNNDNNNTYYPKGYVGTGMACNTCHNRAGAIMDVHNRIYREALPGGDGRFSWHPFNENGQVDNRWFD